jgi:hypothetical protein
MSGGPPVRAEAFAPGPAVGLAPLRAGQRIRLAGEVLRAYVPMLVASRRQRLDDAVATARSSQGTRPLPSDDDERLVAERLGRATARTLTLLPTDSRCLIRSLVLLRLLAQRGVAATLVIGVQPGTSFQAHAWVEHGGAAVLPAGTYDRLLEL